MLQSVLGLVNFCVLLFFGVYVSAAFLDIEPTAKNNWVLFGFGAVLFGVQMVFYVWKGIEFAEMIYPLITHLPLLFLFVLYFRQRVLSSLFSILSAYLCCQVSKWFGVVAFAISGEQWVIYAVRIAVTIPLWFIIIRYASRSVHIVLSKSPKALLIFGILPASYYLFDYIVTVYTEWLYSGSPVVFEFMPFLLCIAYLFFSVIYFKEYEEKCVTEQQKKLIEIQTAQSMREIEEIQRSAYEVSLIRHDMRHFLTTVSSMIESKDLEKAQDYIQKVIEMTDQTALHKFCENETVNMILSAYESRMADMGIQLDAMVAIPTVLPCSELEFTAILSNGLENAMNAAFALEEEKRTVRLKLTMKEEKLLLSIQNFIMDSPEFQDDLPVTKEAGHGLGTQSIRYMTSKLKGNCQFAVENGVFALRVVL